MRSDEVAARVMQDALRTKNAGSAAPVAPVTQREGDNRPYHSDRGIAALRRKVGHVANLVGWLSAQMAALDDDVSYLAIVSGDADLVTIATEVLISLKGGAITLELREDAPQPMDLMITPIAVAAEIDLGDGAHLSLVQWQGQGEVPLSIRDAETLHLLLTETSAVSILHTDRAGSIRIRTMAREFTLKSPPEQAATGMMDVIL